MCHEYNSFTFLISNKMDSQNKSLFPTCCDVMSVFYIYMREQHSCFHFEVSWWLMVWIIYIAYNYIHIHIKSWDPHFTSHSYLSYCFQKAKGFVELQDLHFQGLGTDSPVCLIDPCGVTSSPWSLWVSFDGQVKTTVQSALRIIQVSSLDWLSLCFPVFY